MSVRSSITTFLLGVDPQATNNAVIKLQEDHKTMSEEFDQLKQDVVDLTSVATASLGAIVKDVDRMAAQAGTPTAPSAADLTALSSSIRQVIAALGATETSVDKTADTVTGVDDDAPVAPEPTA